MFYGLNAYLANVWWGLINQVLTVCKEDILVKMQDSMYDIMKGQGVDSNGSTYTATVSRSFE